jgi:hypothetical protein
MKKNNMDIIPGEISIRGLKAEGAAKFLFSSNLFYWVNEKSLPVSVSQISI